MFIANQTFLLVQKLKLATKGFTLGVKAEIEKIFSICPQAPNKCRTLMALYWPNGGKRDTIEFGKPICNPWGQ